jgi:adenylyltransferase/sulfurtransferase
VAAALASCGIGRLLCIDEDPVRPAELRFAPCCRPEDCGIPRTEAIRHALRRFEPLTAVEMLAPLPAAARGCDLVVNALDPGRIGAALRLNRACLAARLPMLSGGCTLDEIALGPASMARETACFMCYRMRLVASAEDPERAFGIKASLDRRRRDESHARENRLLWPLYRVVIGWPQ